MLILLPPSEGKNPSPGTGSFREAHPELIQDTTGVLEALLAWDNAAAVKGYKIQDEAKALAVHQRNLGVLDAPVLPALERYAGVVYGHLGLDKPVLRKRAGKRVLIVSGLFGLIGGETAIPDYKLPLAPWLARYWKPVNSARLTKLAKGKPVLDLLPKSHAGALEDDRRIAVDFRVAGGAKAAGHFGKAIKGRFVRWLLEHNVRDTGRFGEFQEDGYRWDGTNFVQD